MKTPQANSELPPMYPTRALYAGSFDPWSDGHQFVLDNGLEVFSEVHVILAVNPSKSGFINIRNRMILIAAANDPFTNWLEKSPPFTVAKRLKIDTTEGLVVEYAREQQITHLLRGLRSTTDFEAEFNLYFSNRAILNKVQTWALMCPPELLHCSSSYVKAVVGKLGVPFVGTSFLAQAVMTQKSPFLGQIFDLIRTVGNHLPQLTGQNGATSVKTFTGSLQLLFSALINRHSSLGASGGSDLRVETNVEFWKRVAEFHRTSDSTLSKTGTHAAFYLWLWAKLLSEIVDSEYAAGVRSSREPADRWRVLQSLHDHCERLGFASAVLFDRKKIEEIIA